MALLVRLAVLHGVLGRLLKEDSSLGLKRVWKLNSHSRVILALAVDIGSG
jgi:hypothetical protein